MVAANSIQDWCGRLVEEFHPLKVILFGSRGLGTENSGSDTDLLVILPFDGLPCRKALEILERTNPRFAVDLLVRTPEQVQTRLEQRDWFMRDIIENGVVLYEATGDEWVSKAEADFAPPSASFVPASLRITTACVSTRSKRQRTT